VNDYKNFDGLSLNVHMFVFIIPEDSMHVTLRDQLKLCQISLRKNLTKREKWVKEWPGQLCITSSQVIYSDVSYRYEVVSFCLIS
jgi:hypothetical protein